MSDDTPTKVAIACQGGASHTAFTAGVLKELLREWDDGDELVGISGTSGGAFNAAAAWYGLVTADAERAIELLDGIWDGLAAEGLGDRLTNNTLVGTTSLANMGFPLPDVSPYLSPGSELGTARIRHVLEAHIDFDELQDCCTETTPELVVGTVNINAGTFETFTNENVTLKALLASAAVPTLFEAVEINDHYHWDGVFSQNPPIYDLFDVSAARKPDELWVIQINPQEREGEPQSLTEIADRRNELSGNISLNQQLGVVELVNDWLDAGHLPEDEFTHTTIRRITLGGTYSSASKLDRRPAFLQELMELGEQRATAFRERRAG